MDQKLQERMEKAICKGLSTFEPSCRKTHGHHVAHQSVSVFVEFYLVICAGPWPLPFFLHLADWPIPAETYDLNWCLYPVYSRSQVEGLSVVTLT